MIFETQSQEFSEIEKKENLGIRKKIRIFEIFSLLFDFF